MNISFVLREKNVVPLHSSHASVLEDSQSEITRVVYAHDKHNSTSVIWKDFQDLKICFENIVSLQQTKRGHIIHMKKDSALTFMSAKNIPIPSKKKTSHEVINPSPYLAALLQPSPSHSLLPQSSSSSSRSLKRSSQAFIIGLPPRSKDLLYSFFSSFGNISSLVLMKHKDKDVFNGKAIISFDRMYFKSYTLLKEFNIIEHTVSVIWKGESDLIRLSSEERNYLLENNVYFRAVDSDLDEYPSELVDSLSESSLNDSISEFPEEDRTSKEIIPSASGNHIIFDNFILNNQDTQLITPLNGKRKTDTISPLPGVIESHNKKQNCNKTP